MIHVSYGIDTFLTNALEKWSGKRIALVTNQTGITSSYQSTIDALNKEKSIQLVKLFACEHGIRGDVQAGVHIGDHKDEKTSLPVHSLYSTSKKVSTTLLEDVDAVFFDIQDVGVRFYTYLATVKNLMEACLQTNTSLVVMDRPNPIAPFTDGNILEDDFISFVGPYRLPICTGLTVGEYAQLIKVECFPEVDLHISLMKNWNRSIWGDQWNNVWIPPSPNIPHATTTLYYPISCFIEGTNLSEGRGTTKPFEWIGAPWFKVDEVISHFTKKELAGIKIIPTYFTPTMSKHHGEFCSGIQLVITDRTEIHIAKTAYELLQTIFAVHKEADWLPPFKKGMPPFIDYLWGTDKVRKGIDDGKSYCELTIDWSKGIEEWKSRIQTILLYS
ncbi:DUF1343 domain-containing protein [Sutcliffiella cohnii]|uniref:exo-beta-N-acetylmuramidase NamZ family protein n=1 Tax=Sutcliffiella cohnii TaxID=33932 RepID=UPI002E1C8158|nr:DUF1343 domain-containing protein [Sutcliffiella cohnii]